MFVYHHLKLFIWFLVVASIFLATVEHTILRKSRKPYPARPTVTHNSGNNDGSIIDPISPTQLAAVEYKESTKQINGARGELEWAKQQIHMWQSNVEPLLKSATGEAVATNEGLIGKMTFLFSEKRPSLEQVNRWSDRLDKLEEAAEEASMKTTTSRLTPDQRSEIREIHDEARAAARVWSDAVERALAIVRESNRIASNSLEDAVQRHKDKAAIEELEEDQESARERRRAERKRLEEKKLEDERRAEEKEKLVEEATSGEVQAVIAPFIEKTTLQIRISGVGSVGRRRVAEAEGMSYTALVGSGALIDTTRGRTMLARIGTDRKNGANRWYFGHQPLNWTDENAELIGQAQDYLRRLGPTLVSEGLLAP